MVIRRRRIGPPIGRAGFLSGKYCVAMLSADVMGYPEAVKVSQRVPTEDESWVRESLRERRLAAGKRVYKLRATRLSAAPF